MSDPFEISGSGRAAVETFQKFYATESSAASEAANTAETTLQKGAESVYSSLETSWPEFPKDRTFNFATPFGRRAFSKFLAGLSGGNQPAPPELKQQLERLKDLETAEKGASSYASALRRLASPL